MIYCPLYHDSHRQVRLHDGGSVISVGYCCALCGGHGGNLQKNI